MIRPLLVAIAGLAIAAPAASAHADASEIFATNNTAVITDQHDPRLDKRLNGFARRVERIIHDGGAKPRGSELLDGVFFDSALGTTTFERSRVFAVDRADDDELHDIAETVRRRFLQGSVLTFDPRPGGDAVELDVPHVSAGALRTGLLADPEAQERLFGGSVTQDGHLLLVADRGDEAFARAFADKIGGDLERADTTYGDREFVSAATEGRARIEKRTLVLAAGDGDDFVALRDGRRVQIDFGDDGVIDFEVKRRRFDRVRVDGDGQDRLIVYGTDRGDDYDTSDYSGAEVLEFDSGDGEDSLIAREGPQEVDVDPGGGDDRIVINSTNEDEQSSILGFGDSVFVIADPFVSVEHAEPTDRLRLNGRGGDDLLSTSTDAMKITLSAGDGGGTMFGGPGDDVLLGGDDFDLVEGKQGDDVIDLGGDLDSVKWRVGDGDDRIDGGGGARNGMWVFGSDADETFDFHAKGHKLRIGGAAALDVTGIQAFDVLPGSGADVTRIGDLRSAGVTDIHTSLAATIVTAGGDQSADRVELAGANRAATVTGQGAAATVAGLPVRLQLSHSDGLLDTLAITGARSVDRSGLPDGVIALEDD
jgi:hypothetical protein